MTHPRTTGAIAALVTLFAGFVLPVASAAATGTSDVASTADSAVAAPQDGTVAIRLVSNEPAVAQPGDTLRVTVEVVNGLDRRLSGAQVDLGVSWRQMTSRDAVAAWAEDDGNDTASRQLTEAVGPVDPGTSTRVTLELPVDDLALGDDAAWGPREMSLALVGGGSGDVIDTYDVLHTFLLYGSGKQEPEAVSVSVLAPVTGPAADPADLDAYDAELADLTAADGRLSALADAATATSSSPGISLAADPALVAAAADSTTPDGTSWAGRLTDGSVADVAALPAFDPDIAAVAHADLNTAQTAAAGGTGLSLPSTWETPSTWGAALAWPSGTPDLATLGATRDLGVDQVVVSDGLATRDDALASARTAVSTPSGKVSALVADPALSAVVSSLDGSADAPTTAEATQRLLADTAVLATGQDDVVDAKGRAGGLHLLAALPRDWTPDADTVHDVLGAVEQSGWTDVVALDETIGAAASKTARSSLPRTNVDDAELAPASVRELADAQRSVTTFSSVADDPAELAGGVRRDLLVPLSTAFRADPDGRDEAVTSALSAAEDLQDGITVANPTQVTLVSDSGNLPILVRNELPADATITVVLHPDDPRLVAETRPTVVVPAEQSVRVPVKVRAIGSGNVTITVEVLSPSGSAVSEPTSFDVQVRAGWETVGTAVIAVAVGLLFLAGLWRTLRRGRSSSRTTGEKAPPVPADDDPARPARPDAPRDDGPRDDTNPDDTRHADDTVDDDA